MARDSAASSPADVDARLNESILHTLQNQTGIAFRPRLAAVLAEHVNRIAPARTAPTSSAAALAGARQLTDEAYLPLGIVLPRDQIADVVRFFESKPCLNGHVPPYSDGVPRRIGAGAEAFHYGCYTLPDVVAAPHLLELANRPDILDIAEGYLGCAPTLYSIHAWWSFSGHGKAPTSQEFHRDIDDYRFCTLFLYLTDVDLGSGAHQFIRRSHRFETTQAVIQAAAARLGRLGVNVTAEDIFRSATQGYGRDDLYRAVFDGLIETIQGPAGTSFIADTSGLHMGLPLTHGRRLMFWARYGLYRNSAAEGTTAVARSAVGDRIPNDARTAYINRCIVR
jgi:hypothetical protein